MDSDEERNWVYCGMIKLLGSFLKEKRGDICLYIGFIGVFYVIFSLSNLPVDAVNYAFFLSAIWLLGYGIFKFNQYYKKGVAVIEAKKRLEEVTENLPATRSYIELEYQAIIQNMSKKMSDLQSAERIGRQEMKDYYSMWAHQIKTPIAALKLLIEEDIPGEEEPFGADRERLQQQREKRRAEELQQLFAIEQYVNMALSYMRLGSETTDFVLRQTDLDGVIRMAVRRYARHFISKKITLHYEETGARVLTDEKWLGFVIEQLLSNALKYTHEGSITIGMEKGRLTITDTGIGIRAEDLPRVCEKGYTGYNGHANQKSTGIGLYLCSTILKKLGHSFTITSQEGTGTRVTIGFPEES